jgi:phytoene dehydrogenase-like protein
MILVRSASDGRGVAIFFYLALARLRSGVDPLTGSTCGSLDDGTAVLLERNFDDAEAALEEDGAAWRGSMEPLATHWNELAHDILRPLLAWPRHPFLLARFGMHALPSAGFVGRHLFRTERARALFAGLSAHSFLSLDQTLSASFGMVMGISAHAVGWPVPRGGAQSITNALSACLAALGGHVRTATRIESFRQLPKCALASLSNWSEEGDCLSLLVVNLGLGVRQFQLWRQ